ncbi:hypothetical protein F2P79_023870 [Pimephales promelas]|nr:hypothetical protein F2P79_023870 [Pimephales promelas]
MVTLTLPLNHCATAVLTYDRVTLMNIGVYMEGLSNSWESYSQTFPPPLVCVPSLFDCRFLLRGRGNPKKRRRKRGCRAGVRVAMRLSSAMGAPGLLCRRQPRWLLPVFPRDIGAGGALSQGRLRLVLSAGRDPLWLPPDGGGLAVGKLQSVSDLSDQRLVPRHRWKSRDCARCLRPLQPAIKETGLPSSLRLALLNARSITNKAHAINDLIFTEKTDFMFLTETWQKDKEAVHLNELCPAGCSAIGTPRTARRGLEIVNVSVEDVHVSDHSCVFFNLNLPRDPPPLRIKAQRRVFNQDVAGKFSTLFDPCQLGGCSDVNVYVESFNRQCSTILDEVAPMKSSIVSVKKPCPWINSSVQSLRSKRRKIERLWKATKLEVHRLYLRELTASLNELLKNARTNYFSQLISSNKKNPKFLFDSINSIVSPSVSPNAVLTLSNSNVFLDFFVEKIKDIRASILPPPAYKACTLALSYPCFSFKPVSSSDITTLLDKLKPSYGQSDVLPTMLFKQTIATVFLFALIRRILVVSRLSKILLLGF